MQHDRLFADIRSHMLCGLRDYLPQPELKAARFVTPPGLGSAAGIKGALVLAIASAAAPVR